MVRFLKYIERVGIALSVLLNVLLGGPSNQTFSARNWQRKRDGKINLVWLIDRIYWYDSCHCLICWSYWKVRKDVLHEESQLLNKEFLNGQESLWQNLHL